MDYTEYTDMFHKRLSELRLQKGVSARDMSLSLGQSESYINKIENKRTLPSLSGFIYICEYFEISPQEFFDYDNKNPKDTEKLTAEIQKLNPKQQEYILALVSDLAQKNPTN